MNRRVFISCIACSFLFADARGHNSNRTSQIQQSRRERWEGDLKEAMWYVKLNLKKVRCDLCPRKCVVDDRERGFCGVRENRDGIYYTLVYSNPCAVHIDPIEKKPFFHFLPATLSFSIATAGCNIECAYCQNWEISQRRPEQTENIYMPPKRVVELAKHYGCKSISFTYTEPVVFYEYMVDTAKLARHANIRALMVTNAFIEPKPMQEACKVLDAVKVDLKAFSEEFYRKICRGQLKPVLKAIEVIKSTGTWLELVVLIVPKLNDSPTEIKQMCNWVKTNLGSDVPIHFSRFIPMYKLRNLPPTPVETLERCHDIAKEIGLRYVYIGNVFGHPAESTYCPNCNSVVIQRMGYKTSISGLRGNKCAKCKFTIAGVWA
ncbi:MAG: AmmeMemoRadiSam system radical SAM enzyme [Armatimonadota bacterium]|nr:AmmeMemoRadiSam system radical SAM enzyme [Armatimonadota bacterium]MCX7776828.1 AmmeMemoRadiSam system radical SAM enzyme [Armatimonadota bacterium]MDW8024623.1 AmmeMemoRadiSam system radical SAM enzyme [Armatimonadota bacterium]